MLLFFRDQQGGPGGTFIAVSVRTYCLLWVSVRGRGRKSLVRDGDVLVCLERSVGVNELRPCIACLRENHSASCVLQGVSNLSLCEVVSIGCC